MTQFQQNAIVSLRPFYGHKMKQAGLDVHCMNHNEFYRLSYELWGNAWPSILADKFEINAKSVKRWANGRNEIPLAAIEFILFQAKNKGIE